jgi:hypothetical protein
MKLNIKTNLFTHHRDGWRAAVEKLKTIHNPLGIDFYDWVDVEFKKNNVIQSPWVGILHNTLTYPKEYLFKYNSDRIFPLTNLIYQENFIKSMKNCYGLFTLSNHTKNFLQRHLEVEIEKIWHPIIDVKPKFNINEFLKNPKIVTIGQWLRKYHSICNLKINYRKYILKTKMFDEDYNQIKNYTTVDIEFINYLDNDQYDILLSNTIVFLDLYDAAACNTILECIIRNTPIVVNALPAVVEYLGTNYPLYYQSLEEASKKINDFEQIKKAHNYLSLKNKDNCNPINFINSIQNSKIYKNLPSINFM